MWKTDGSEEVSFSKLAFGFRSNCQTVLLRHGTAHSGAAGDFVQLPAFVLCLERRRRRRRRICQTAPSREPQRRSCSYHCNQIAVEPAHSEADNLTTRTPKSEINKMPLPVQVFNFQVSVIRRSCTYSTSKDSWKLNTMCLHSTGVTLPIVSQVSYRNASVRR